MPAKYLFSAICAGVLFFAASSNASAADITFAGYTNGCFGAACVLPNTSAPQAANLTELMFANTTFNGTSVGGVLDPVLGTFSLNPQGFDDYTGSVFKLQVSFTLPSTIAGGSSGVFVANLTGFASSAPGQCEHNEDCANLTINFSDAPLEFTYSNPTASGSFSLYVDDVVFDFTGLDGDSSAVRDIQGHIVNAIDRGAPVEQAPVPAPEPGSMILLGTGLVALAYRRHRGKA